MNDETYSGGRTRIERERSGVGIFFAGGFVFLLPVPAVLVFGAWAAADPGEILKGLFPLTMTVLAGVSATAGLITILIAGFILLVRQVPTPSSDILGSAAPQSFRKMQSDARLDLRAFWFPCLAAVGILTVFRFLVAGGIIPQEMVSTGTALAVVVLEVCSFVGFFFFWGAGIVRLNRAGSALPYSAFTWPAVALTLFSLPVIFL